MDKTSRGIIGEVKQKKGWKGWTTSPTCGASRPLFQQQIRRPAFCLFPFLIEEFNNACVGISGARFHGWDTLSIDRYKGSHRRKFMIAGKEEGASMVNDLLKYLLITLKTCESKSTININPFASLIRSTVTN